MKVITAAVITASQALSKVDFGSDGGVIQTNGKFKFDGSIAGKELTSCGHPVEIVQTKDGYVGVANGETVFTLTINPETGEYTFTLTGIT